MMIPFFVLCVYSMVAPSEPLHFVCPADLFLSAGPEYWLLFEQKIRDSLPSPSLSCLFWYDVGLNGGHALGALRLGIRHLLYRGSLASLKKLQEIAEIKQAFVRTPPPSSSFIPFPIFSLPRDEKSPDLKKSLENIINSVFRVDGT